MLSVMYLSTVRSVVQSSKRIEYPTSFPSLVPTSSAALRHRHRRHPPRLRAPHLQRLPVVALAEARLVQILGKVVLPLPVSPTMMSTWCSLTS